MNMTPTEALALVETLKPLVVSDDVDVAFCVPAIDIIPVGEAIKGTNIGLGAENMYMLDKGAYTGEISAPMLADAGVKYVIIGHSERRQYFGETDEDVNAKIKKALEYGLTPIVCVGETLEQREMGITIEWVSMQVKKAYYGIAEEDVVKTVIAYEPIWAIGTGKTATEYEAEEVCGGIRQCVFQNFSTDGAENMRILYGGSVNAGNAALLFAQPDIDGGLVGGASLKPEFGDIVNYNK